MQHGLHFSTGHAVEPFAIFGRRHIRRQVAAIHVKKYFRSHLNRQHNGANESYFVPSSVQEVARSRPCCSAASRMGGEAPQEWTQVVSWAHDEFHRCVSPDLPDARLHLAKACLLVALEEEAARSGEAAHPELGELMALLAPQMRPRSAAVASTWSGERLEALAAEVAALLDRTLEESGAGAQQQHRPQQQAGTEAGVGEVGAGEAANGVRPAGTGSTDGEQDLPPLPNNMNAAPSTGTAPDGGTDGGTDGVHVSVRDNEINDPPVPTAAATAAADGSTPFASSSFDFEAEQEQLLDRIHSSQPGAVCSRSGTASGGGFGSSSEGVGRDEGEGHSSGENSDRYYGSAWPSGRRRYGKRQALYRRYPVQTLAAVNTVLFDRHGYRPCNRYGVPSDHQLSAVLEVGVGASAALSILYLEVCERLGFPLAARPLDDGRYFVLWPVDAPLTADGQRFLVDPYGRGGLLLLDEVCEIFGVEPCNLVPATRRELLAALLGELRDSHWAASAGCSPMPGTMTPLSLGTALGNKVTVPTTGVRAAALKRALATAEKRLWLLPEDSETQLQYGLLLYFSRRYDDAWIELSLYLERFAASNGSAPGPLSLPLPEGHDAAPGGSGRDGAIEERTAAGEYARLAGTGPSLEVGREVEDWGGEHAGGTEGSVGDGEAVRGAEPTAGPGDVVVEMDLDAGSSGQQVDAVLGMRDGRREEAREEVRTDGRATDATMDTTEGALLFGVDAAGGSQGHAGELQQRGGAGAGGGLGPEGGVGAAEEGMGTMAGALSDTERSSVVQQVKLLVERIRLVLDLAPAGLAS